MVLRGGLRDRMVFHSVMEDLRAELQAQGWLDATVYDTIPGSRQHRPITIVDEYPEDDTEVDLNTIAFSWGNAEGQDMELGSKQEVHYQAIFVDVFAENDAIGRHLIGDLYAYIRENMQFDVYDYSVATPTLEFVAEVEEVDRRKPTRVVNAWQKHWYTLAFTVTDERANA